MLGMLTDRKNSWVRRRPTRGRARADAKMFRSCSRSCCFERLEPRVLLSAALYERVDYALEASAMDYAGGLIAVDLNGDDLLDLVTANVGSLPGEKKLPDPQLCH